MERNFHSETQKNSEYINIYRSTFEVLIYCRFTLIPVRKANRICVIYDISGTYFPADFADNADKKRIVKFYFRPILSVSA
jgi:hypothetical protein